MNLSKKEELEILSNALIFLNRIDLKGHETKAFSRVMEYIDEKGKSIDESLKFEKTRTGTTEDELKIITGQIVKE